MDPECEVCLQPIEDDTAATVTFDARGVSVAVLFCRDCVTAVLGLMGDRYNQAVEQQNAAVEAVLDMLGIPPR